MVIEEKDALQVFTGFDSMPEEQRQRAAALLADYRAQQERLGAPLWPSQEAEKRKQRERARNVIFDPLKLDEENGAYVQAERVAPGAGESMRKRDAAIAWTAARYGVEETEVRTRWQLYKADMGRKWQTGILDDGAFYDRARKEQQDEDARLETLLSAQEAAFQAALEGKPMIQALNAWQGLDQGPQPDGKLDATPAFMRTFSRVGEVLRPFRPLVKAAPEAMRRTMQGEANEKDAETLERLAWTVADAQGDERELLMQALASGVRQVAQEGGERGVGGTFTAAGGRLIESMFGPQFESLSDLNPNRLAFPGVIDSPEAAQKAVAEELRIRASERLQGALAGEVSGFIAPAPARELSPEESALVKVQIERQRKLVTAGRQLKRLALESDPLRSDWLGVMSSGTASTLTLALPLAFGGWGTFSAAAGYTKMEAEELLTENPEMSGEDALMIGALSGSIQATLDKASLFGLGKFSPNLRKLLTGQGSKELVKRAALETGGVLAFENVVEGLQDIATPTVQAIVSELRETVPQVNWDEEWERWKDTRADVFIGMLPLIMLGAGVQTIRNKSHVEALLRNDRDLARAGVVEADRVAISEQLQTGDVEGATATLQEAWDRRSPELAAEMGNEQEAEMIEAARLIQAAERAGMIPTIRRDAQGWTVERDGASVRVSTREEAVAMAYASLDEMERQAAEATAQMADEFMDLGQGRAEAFEISQQPASVQSEVDAGRQSPEGAARQVEVFAQIHGLTAEEARAESLSVLGSNRAEMVEGVRTAVSRVFGGGNILTALHEGVHGRWSAGLASGHYSHGQGLMWVRMAEQASGVEFLPSRDDAAVTPAMLDEAIVDVVQADVLGRRKDGKQHFTPGLISRGVASFALAGRAEAKQAGRLATFLRAWREFWGRVLRAGRAMAKARKEGKLGDDFDGFLDDLLGAEPQQRHEAAASKEAVEMAAEIDPDNMPFSLAPFSPRPTAQANFQKVMDAFERGESLGRQPISIGLTPPVLRVAGADGRGLFMPPTLPGKVTQERHAVPVAVLRELLNALHDPVAVFQSRKRPDSLLVLTEFEEPGAGPLLVAVTLDKQIGREWIVNEIASVYGKPSGTVAQMFGESVLYENKEKSSVWARRVGQLLPARGTPTQNQGKVPGPADVVKWTEQRRSVDGGASFSLAPGYGYDHRPREDGPRAFDLAEEDMMPADVYDHPEWYSGMSPKVIQESMAQLRRVRGKPSGKVTIYRAGPKGEMNQGDWVSLSREYARTHAMSQDPGEYKVWSAQVAAADVRWAMDDIAEFGYFGESVPAEDSGVRFSLAPRSLASVADTVLAAKMRKPEFREKYFSLARQLIEKVRRDGEWRVDRLGRASRREGMDSMADRIRTPGNIEAERKFRMRSRQRELIEQGMAGLTRETLEAYELGLTTIEDNPLVAEMLSRGKLMSKSAAAKSGKLKTDGAGMAGDYDGSPWLPPSWYAGGSNGYMPDVMAQELYDAGLLGAATPDALWSALDSAIKSARAQNEQVRAAQKAVRDIEANAQRQAREEADAWAKDERANVPTPKERQMAALRTLDAILSAFPPEIRGRVGGFVKLAGLGTDKAREAEIQRRLDKLDEVVESEARKHYRAKMDALLKRARPKKKAGEKPKGKLGADVHDLVETVEGAMSLTAEKAEAHAAGLEAEILGGELTTEQEAHAGIEAELVRLVADWNPRSLDGKRVHDGADAARMEAAVNALDEVISKAYAAAMVETAAKRERRKAARSSLVADTGKQGTAAERKERAMKLNNVGGWARKAVAGLVNFDQLLQRAFGENSTEAARLANWQREADNQKEDAMQAAADETSDFFAALAGSRYKGERLRWQMSQPSMKVGGLRLSQMEAITATLMWRQPDGRRHMEGYFDENGKPAGPWNYSEEWVAEVEGNLSSEALALRDWLSEKYARGWAPLNAVYRRMNGINLPRIANYAPVTVKPVMTKDSPGIDPVTGSAQAVGSTPGGLKTRGTAIAEPDFKDALQVFISHTKQMEHWKAYAEFVAEARAVLGHREVGNAVEAKDSDEVARSLRGWLDYFANGGARDAAAQLALTQGLSRATNRIAAATLVGRIGTLLIQATQLGAAAAKMPLPAYVRGMSKLFGGQLGWGGAIRSDYIQRRIKQMPPILQQAMEGLASAKPNRVTDAARQVGWLLSGADGLFTAGTYAIVHDYQMRQARGLGFSAQEAQGIATRETERIMDQIAQPTRAGARSLFEVNATSPGWRIGWAFASEGRKNLGLLIAAGQNGMTSARMGRALVYVILINSGLAWLIRTAWSDARSDDDDEELWSSKRFLLAMSTEWLSGIPFLGSALQAAAYKRAGEWAPEGNLLSSAVRSVDAWGRVPEMLSGELSTKEVLRDVEMILQGMALGNDTLAALASFSHLVRDTAGLADNAGIIETD